MICYVEGQHIVIFTSLSRNKYDIRVFQTPIYPYRKAIAVCKQVVDADVLFNFGNAAVTDADFF